MKILTRRNWKRRVKSLTPVSFFIVGFYCVILQDTCENHVFSRWMQGPLRCFLYLLKASMIGSGHKTRPQSPWCWLINNPHDGKVLIVSKNLWCKQHGRERNRCCWASKEANQKYLWCKELPCWRIWRNMLRSVWPSTWHDQGKLCREQNDFQIPFVTWNR